MSIDRECPDREHGPDCRTCAGTGRVTPYEAELYEEWLAEENTAVERWMRMTKDPIIKLAGAECVDGDPCEKEEHDWMELIENHRQNIILTDIMGIIREHFDVPQNKLVPSAVLIDDLGLDSLDTLEVVMAMEEKFMIEISDEDAERCISIKDCANLVDMLTRNSTNGHAQGLAKR